MQERAKHPWEEEGGMGAIWEAYIYIYRIWILQLGDGYNSIHYITVSTKDRKNNVIPLVFLNSS